MLWDRHGRRRDGLCAGEDSADAQPRPPACVRSTIAAGASLALHRIDRGRRRIDMLEERIEAFADREWEWREADAANRAKSRFLAMVSP
jgi:hypothetical protein